MNHPKAQGTSGLWDVDHLPIVDAPRFFPAPPKAALRAPSDRVVAHLVELLSEDEDADQPTRVARKEPYPPPASRDDDFEGRTEVGFQLAVPPLGGRFRLMEKLGGGGMGEVYRALDLETRREVAVKMPHLHSAYADKRFEIEVDALAAVVSPGTVGFVARGDSDEPFLAMELVQGSTLLKVMELSGALPPAVAYGIARRVAACLSAVHLGGWVHRDIKPSNIVVTDDGGVRLVDFGLARKVEGPGAGTQTGQIVGTLGYLAPEQLGSKRVVDPATDVFALGCVLFEALTGERAFRRELSEVVVGQWRPENHPPLPVERVRGSMRGLVADLTAVDTARRPRDGLAALLRVLSLDPEARKVADVERGLAPAVREVVQEGLAGPVAITGGALCGKSRVARAAALLLAEIMAPAVVVHVRCDPRLVGAAGGHAAPIERTLRQGGFRAAAATFRGESPGLASRVAEPSLVLVLDDASYADARTASWAASLARSGVARVIATVRPEAPAPDGFTTVPLPPAPTRPSVLEGLKSSDLRAMRLCASYGVSFELAAISPVAAHVGIPLAPELPEELCASGLWVRVREGCYAFDSATLWEEVLRTVPEQAPLELERHARAYRESLGRAPVAASITWRTSASYGATPAR